MARLNIGDDHTVANILCLVALIVAAVALLMSVPRDKISDEAAECASLGGVYSNESDSCYYAGEQTTASSIRERLGQ